MSELYSTDINMPGYIDGIKLANAGADLTSGCVTRDHDRSGYSGNRHDNDGAQVSVEFGSIEYAYNDGYWDNPHQWHQWSNDNDRDSYRRYQGGPQNCWSPEGA